MMEVILPLVKNTIVKGKFYDAANPEIVLCSQQLENMFSMKAFHLEQLAPALLKSLMPLQDESEDSGVYAEKLSIVPPTECSPTTSKSAKVDRDRWYVMTERLNQLLLPNAMGKVVSFKEVADLLSKYIIGKKDHLFDARNILVALVENDPLGAVFGVKAFHRKQTAYFINQQLLPVPKEETDPMEVVIEKTRITIAELCSAKSLSNERVPSPTSEIVKSPKRCAESMDDSELPVKKRFIRHATI